MYSKVYIKEGADFILRGYQEEAISDLASAMRDSQRVLLQMMVGSGKTVVASEIMRRAVEKGRKVLFLANRRELVRQCSSKLRAYGVPHGFIMAGEWGSPSSPVQVASIATLASRGLKRKSIEMPEADLLIHDEAHGGVTPTMKKVFAAYPNARVLGLTATPARGDGKSLGLIYEDMVIGPSVNRLIAEGALVPCKYYAPSIPDLKKVRIVRGDYDESQLGSVMDKPALIGDIIDHWEKHSRDRKTIVFASSVSHSRNLAYQFNQRGIPAIHIDGTTRTDDRDIAIRDFDAGVYQVLVNCQVYIEGFDSPEISTVVLARPTKSVVRFIQMIGRGMRPNEFSDGSHKEFCLVLDHAGSVIEHGFVEEDRPWSLDAGSTIQERTAKERKENTEPSPIVCQSCGFVFTGSRVCPKCGAKLELRGMYVETEKGELVLIDRLTKKEKKAPDLDRKKEWYGMFLGHARKMGYKEAWARHSYRMKFKSEPGQEVVKAPAMQPDAEVNGFIRYMSIRRARGLARAAK